MRSDVTALACQECGANALRFEVLVSAGSAQSRVRGVHGTALKVAVRSPPEGGKANAEVLELLAGCLDLPAANLQIVSGLHARQKRVVVFGLTAPEFRARLARSLAAGGQAK